ncbi:MAG: hypothetical protein JOZ41_08575 [Chloroflexi bacterium]|nr:hypothetical protein [Chloroflexota bacterium]
MSRQSRERKKILSLALGRQPGTSTQFGHRPFDAREARQATTQFGSRPFQADEARQAPTQFGHRPFGPGSSSVYVARRDSQEEELEAPNRTAPTAKLDHALGRIPAYPAPLQRQDEGEGEESEGPREIAVPEGEEVEARAHGPCDQTKLDNGGSGGSAGAKGKKAKPTLPANLTVDTGTITFTFTNPQNLKVSSGSFGQEQFKCSHKKAKTAVDPAGIAKPSFTIALKCPWNVHATDDKEKDVPSGNASVVTTKTHKSGKKVYEQIADDLTPNPADNWRPARTYFWSKALTKRHEKFHSTDDEQWAKSAGKAVVSNYLDGKTVSSKNVKKEMKTLLDNAMVELKNANTQFYEGGGSEYIQYAGEKRAFLDGKDEYTKLVADVRARGQQLEKAEQEKAAKKGSKTT